MSSPRKLQKSRSYAGYSRSVSSDNTEMDFTTANEVFPMRVPLETVQIGPCKYTSSELDDIELLYELDSSDLLISTNVRGSNGAVPSLYRIKSISAADLSLVCVIPESLESMVARLVLETDKAILCSYKTGGESDNVSATHELNIGIIKMTASVHDSGHLRDVLLFLKCNYQMEMKPDPFYVPSTSSPAKETEGSASLDEERRPKLTFVERLPYWVLYVPWMLYSKRVRRLLQYVIFMYSIFTVFWAAWQLYRHVNIIRVVMQPIIAAMRIYLSSLVEAFDWTFSMFTLLWHRYFSPLNILRTILLAPIFQLAMELKTIFTPFCHVLSQCLFNTGLLQLLQNIFYIFYVVIYTAGSTLFAVLAFLVRPISSVWNALLNSRIAVASLDFQRLRLSWVFQLVIGSIRTIIRGIAKFLGYKWQEKRIKAAMVTTNIVTPISSPEHSSLRNRRSTMPLFYRSPITKQE